MSATHLQQLTSPLTYRSDLIRPTLVTNGTDLNYTRTQLHYIARFFGKCGKRKQTLFYKERNV